MMTNAQFADGIDRYEVAEAAAAAAQATTTTLSREAIALLAPLAAEVAARQ